MITNRLAKVAIAAVAVGAPLLTASAAFAATPSLSHTLQPNGYSVVEGCSSFSGQITYTPGLLTTKLKAQTAVISGTLSNCQDSNGAQVGTGAINGVLSGKSSLNTTNLSGTLVVSWPGFNPSTVSVSLTGANQGVDTLNGTITSGAFTTGILRTSLLPVGNTGTGTAKHPVTSQAVVNTAPVNALVNFG
jgi:hypothetical protein